VTGFGPTAVQEARHRFAGSLQSALTLQEVENAFLHGAEEVIPSGGLGLYRLCTESGRVLDVRAEVAAPDFLDEYEAYGRADDPVLDFVIKQHRPIDSSRVVNGDRWECSGARSALGTVGYAHSLEAPVLVSGLLFGTINFARAETQPAFDDVDLVSARLVAEQLGLATERALRFETTGQRATVLETVLDRIPQAVVVTDLDARLLFRNRAARNEPSISAAFTTQTAQGNPVGDTIAEAMEEFRLNGKRAHTCSVRERGSDRQVIVKSYRLSDQQNAAMTLVFTCAEEQQANRLPAWGVLSRREQEIAELVSQGLTTKQIADRAFISENTVKQHLKRVFAKTDVRNRAELVQLIWTAGKPVDGREADG
jgi:DNA-binding CsgD family transcriptional regulator/PAS domain-containing protein